MQRFSFALVLLLIGCSVDTERYTFVDVDGGTGGCVDDACSDCKEGFERVGENQCGDVDECEQEKDDCDTSPSACVNRDNGLGYVCECPAGFEGNGRGENGCIGTAACEEGTIDVNGDGSECYRPFDAVALGGEHGCGLRGGQLHCWGAAEHGQLGLGGEERDLRARRRPVHVGEGAGWELIGLGARHSCGVRDGKLTCFGDNTQGQLGTGSMEDAQEPKTVATDAKVVALALGAEHSCALQTDLLSCWGSNRQGRAGLGDDAMSRLMPVRVGDAGSWTALASGKSHSCAVRAGEPFCWGDGGAGQLGLGSADEQYVPTSIDATGMWQLFAAGDAHSCAIRAGELHCFGDNAAGQLGLGDTMARMTPARVGTELDWSALVAGSAHTCGLRGKALFCWGDNSAGQLGVGDEAPRSEPTAVELLIEPEMPVEWDAVAAGGNSTCALSTGVLFCWGENGSGQLGVGDIELHNTPTLVQ